MSDNLLNPLGNADFISCYQRFKIILLIFLLPLLNLSTITLSKGQDDRGTIKAPLFSSDEPLNIRLEANFRDLVEDKDADDPEYYHARLIHEGIDEDREFEIKIKARGITRRKTDICSFPPLMLNFKKRSTSGTIFDGQNKIKLVTYCKNADPYEIYVLQEYLIYRTYNVLSDTSLQVRLARITYYDTGKTKDIATRFGFLIEDIDEMAARLGGKEIDLLLPHHDICERTNLDRFILFQYMIGNTDWWIARPKLHNVKLISINTGPPIPIPYDFDFCGAINTSYAVPSESLPIKSVRQRYFRGFCRNSGDYEDIIAGFISRKDTIYQLYDNFPYLNEQIKKAMLQYYDQFYKIIEDPKNIIRHFYDTCPIRHTHLHEM